MFSERITERLQVVEKDKEHEDNVALAKEIAQAHATVREILLARSAAAATAKKQDQEPAKQKVAYLSFFCPFFLLEDVLTFRQEKVTEAPSSLELQYQEALREMQFGERNMKDANGEYVHHHKPRIAQEKAAPGPKLKARSLLLAPLLVVCVVAQREFVA